MLVIRAQGYAATSIDDICAAAGLTKGGFFHHFPSKQALGVAAAGHFAAMAEELFASAPFHAAEDPLERLLGYIDFRAALLSDDLPDCSCLLGTMVQETYGSHPALRDACEAGITGHAATLVADIEAARARYAPAADWTSESLALFTQTVLQGAFVLAKAGGGGARARGQVAHLRRYVELLFPRTANQE
jgi:TetR/AcrR family transcriptional repressor of nem operon